MASLAGAEKIKQIIETQGHTIALQILHAQTEHDGLTLADWFTKHLQVKSISVTEGTIAGYEAEAKRTWLPRLGDLPLTAITRDHVIEWITWQMKQPTQRSQAARQRAEESGSVYLPKLVMMRPKTIRNAHGLLSSVLETAVEAEHIPRNVAKGAPLPKDDQEEEQEIFDHDEWARFYEQMQDDYKAFTAALIVSGARIGEATAFQVRDLNLKMKSISVVRAWKKGRGARVLGAPKSRRSRRTILLPDWALEIFAKAADGKNPEDLLFTSPTGKRISVTNYTNRQWKNALAKAGIAKALTPHSARHTFASWQLMAGVPAQVVQHRLGHESLATTSLIYGHLLLGAQSQGVEALGWEPIRDAEVVEITRRSLAS